MLEASGAPPRPLITVTPPHREEEEFGTGYRSETPGGNSRAYGLRYPLGSADLSKIFFAADDSLIPGTGALEEELSEDVAHEKANEEEPEYGNYLYEWTAGHLALAGVLPASEGGGVARHTVLGGIYNEATDSTSGPIPNLENAVSTDGSRVFWTDLENGNLYVREDATRTALVAAGGHYLSATPDGSRVFFAKGNVVRGRFAFHFGEEFSGTDLYEYAPASGETHDLSGGEVWGFLGASQDGEYAYFVSPEKLTAEETNARGEKALAGKTNLFVSEPDPAHPSQHLIRFIATLGEGENENADWNPTAFARTSEVSPNGRYLAFNSEQSLTGVSNPGPCPENNIPTEPCNEIFLYAAPPGGGKGTLACASCNPGGSPNAGGALPNDKPGYGARRQRYVLDNGELFFTTASALLEADVNATSDVYEYQGGEAGDGQPHLISSGTAEGGAVFADATPSGSDVFFTTPQSLVAQDLDAQFGSEGDGDVYDARVDGGLPIPLEQPPCESPSGCHESTPSHEEFHSPSTSTFHGPGNETPCPKGRVRRRGQCVKPKKHKKHAHHKRAANTNRGGHK